MFENLYDNMKQNAESLANKMNLVSDEIRRLEKFLQSLGYCHRLEWTDGSKTIMVSWNNEANRLMCIYGGEVRHLIEHKFTTREFVFSHWEEILTKFIEDMKRKNV